MKFSVITDIHSFRSFSSGSLIGIRSQNVYCEQTSLSERSSGDGGSDRDGDLALSDEGGSATEEIYATISRRKKRTTCQDAYFFRLLKKWHSIPARMEWSFHSGRNEGFHYNRNGMVAFHSGQNGMAIPFHSE